MAVGYCKAMNNARLWFARIVTVYAALIFTSRGCFSSPRWQRTREVSLTARRYRV
jgi:hypothetical protein